MYSAAAQRSAVVPGLMRCGCRSDRSKAAAASRHDASGCPMTAAARRETSAATSGPWRRAMSVSGSRASCLRNPRTIPSSRGRPVATSARRSLTKPSSSDPQPSVHSRAIWSWGAAAAIAASRSSGGGPARSQRPRRPMPPGAASAIASQVSAASSCVSRLRTAATSSGRNGRPISAPGTLASGAMARMMPRLAFDRVTRRDADTAARIVRPRGCDGAASIAGAIARPAATNSAWSRSGNDAPGWTFPGFSAVASSRQASAMHHPRVPGREWGPSFKKGSDDGS